MTQVPPVLICARCEVPLTPGKVIASYLGFEFPIELHRCPSCGQIHVPEGLALGKMLQVEQMLEDK
jgi:uncharacterized OB-fold protein